MRGCRKISVSLGKRPQAHEQTEVDLATAETASQDAHAVVLGLEKDLADQRLALKQAIGLPPDATVNLRDVSLPSHVSTPSYASLTNNLEERRLDLLALKEGLRERGGKTARGHSGAVPEDQPRIQPPERHFQRPHPRARPDDRPADLRPRPGEHCAGAGDPAKASRRIFRPHLHRPFRCCDCASRYSCARKADRGGGSCDSGFAASRRGLSPRARARQRQRLRVLLRPK